MAESKEQRVARLSVRASLALQLGTRLLEAQEGPCDCWYPGGRARYVNPTGKPVHQCGR